ncbi:MAG: hypothetical protein IJE68_00225 [Clostridia bacterium]|nr:hypothetical protein [Clostridia bacterium]
MFKTTKAKVIFVLVFSIICIITTILLVLYKNIEIEEISNTDVIQETSDKVKEKDVLGIDLEGTYNQNDLVIEEASVTKENVEIRYFQISGLKNKIIENKINKEIEHIALNWYKEEITNLNEVINVYVSMWNSANFADTISFNINYVAKIDDNDDGFYQGFKGINYDLNSGEKITIDKMFTSDAPIENILRQAAYYDIASSKTEDNLAGDLVVSDYGEIEDEIFEIINSYKKGEITDFYYSPQAIYLVYQDNEKTLSIEMEDYAEYIAIYNRYLSKESLYENNNVGMKNLYTLSNRYKDIYYYQNYQKADNYFIEISIDFQSTQDDQFAKKLVQDKISAIESEIEKVKQKGIENPNKFYILNYYISIYTGQEWSTQQILTNCWEYGNSYEMSVHDFEENIEPIIIQYNRAEESGGIPDYVYNFSEMLKTEPQTVTEYYNPETGDKIVI